MEIDELIEAELKKARSSEETITLWHTLLEAYDQGGADGVKALIQLQVKKTQRRVDKEAREVGRVAAVAARPKRRGRRWLS